MKILVTGHRGQLGRDLIAALVPAHDIRGVDLDELDITDPAAVKRCVQDFSPGSIVNCAAFTAVDAAEQQRDLARAVNEDGPRNLARAAGRVGARLIHISTDFVFDGRRPPPAPYLEDDPTGPLSQYGRTKLAGEQAVRENARRWAVVRTAWLYGAGGANFLKTMLRLALADPRREIRVVDDQHGCPTWSGRLARQLVRLIETGGQGVYHATGEGHCTWYALARRFLESMGVAHNLSPCTTAEYPTPARRPANSILENGRLKAAGICVMEDWERDLDRFVARHREQLLQEAGGN